MPESARAAVEELIRQPPPLHATAEGVQCWSVGPEVLRWLADNVAQGAHTIETGCGHSSIVFALTGARHTIVAPNPPEHERVRTWCAERGFSTEQVRSVVAFSQDALPGLADEEKLDVGLIDGAHAFPTPFIDWYFIAARLRAGAYLLVDDVELPTCRLLRDFLAAEDGRWELLEEVDGTAIFRRTSEDALIPPGDWCQQPWVLAQLDRQRPAAERLRKVLRPRTRLHALATRLRRG